MKRKILLLMLLVLSTGSLALRAQQLEEAAQEVANQISLSLIEQGKKSIALLPFTDLRNTTTPIGEAFTEELFNRLFRLRNGKFEIVERTRIRAIWNEQKEFSDQWLLDNLPAFSQILGADAILVGTHFELDGYHRINARLLAVPSGQFLATASTRMQAISGLRMGGDPSGTGETRNDDSLGTQSATAEGPDLRVDLRSCELRGNKLTCAFVVTSTEEDKRVYWHEARLIASNGAQIAPSLMEFGATSASSGWSRVYADLVRGVPMRALVTFEGLDGSLARAEISLIELRFDDWRAQFRDVRVR